MCEGVECSREEMHECGRNQHSSAKVLRVEDEMMGPFTFGGTLRDEGEATT